MEELKVIDNELVPVYMTSTGEEVVYGTELHRALEVKSKYADWAKNRLNDCDAVKNKDYELFSKILEKGRPVTEYIIQLATAKEMAMLERNEKGKQVRRYFIQVEEKYKEQKAKSPLELLELEFAAIKEVDSKVKAVNQDLQDFKRDLPILGIEESRITSAVKRKGVRCLGGKGSNAYGNKGIRGKLYSDLYNELKRQFGVGTYKAIRRNQCDMAIDIIDGYEPPVCLQELISNCNAQMSMENC